MVNSSSFRNNQMPYVGTPADQPPPIAMPSVASPPKGPTHANTNDVEEFFNEYEHPLAAIKRFYIPGLVFTAFLVVYFVSLQFTNVPATKSVPEHIEVLPDGIAHIVEFLAAGMVALGAAMLAVYLVNVANIRRLGAIRNLGQPAFLKELFITLSGYNGRFTENKHIDLTFERMLDSADGELHVVVCTLVVTQRIVIDKEYLTFGIKRLDRNDEKRQHVSISLQEITTPDEYFTIDETDMRLAFPNDVDNFFGSVELFVDSKRFSADDEKSANRLEFREENGERMWRANVGGMRSTRPVDVKYEIGFPLEVPGYQSFFANDPTRGFTCTLDYSRVADRVSVYFQEFLSTTAYVHDVRNDPDKTKKVTICYDRWVLPKSGVFFTWYLKRAATRNGTEKDPVVVPSKTEVEGDAAQRLDEL